MYVLLSRQKQIQSPSSKEGNSWFQSKPEALEYAQQFHDSELSIKSTLDRGVWSVIEKTDKGERKVDTLFESENINMFIPAPQ